MGMYDLEWLEQPQEKEQLFTPNPDVVTKAPVVAKADPLVDELSALRKESDENANRKANLGMWGAVGDALSSGQNFGNFFTGKMNDKNNTASRMTGAVADSIDDPMSREQKAMAYIESKRKNKAAGDQQSYFEGLKNDNSPQAKAFKAGLISGGIPADAINGVSAFDLYNAGYSPSKLSEIKAKSQVEFENDMRKLKFGKQADLERHLLEARERDRAKQDERVEKRDLKKQDEAESLTVPGYNLEGIVKPDKEEAKKARTAVGQIEGLRNNVKRMKELVKNNGSFEFGGTAGAEMEGVYGDLQMSLKNLYELGAITGPDMAILANQLKDPGSLSAMFTRDSTRQKELDTLLSNLENRVETNLKAKGYSAAPVKKETTSEDMKAIDWAMKNQNDPRAAEILKRNGHRMVSQ